MGPGLKVATYRIDAGDVSGEPIAHVRGTVYRMAADGSAVDDDLYSSTG